MRSGETRSPAPRLLRARRERPCGYTAADECYEVPPPHGADPKAKDHGLTIADQGGASQQEAVTSVRCGSIAPRAISASRHHMSALLRKRTSSRHFDLSALCPIRTCRAITGDCRHRSSAAATRRRGDRIATHFAAANAAETSASTRVSAFVLPRSVLASLF